MSRARPATARDLRQIRAAHRGDRPEPAPTLASQAPEMLALLRGAAAWFDSSRTADPEQVVLSQIRAFLKRIGPGA
jgi:hypothetical protein